MYQCDECLKVFPSYKSLLFHILGSRDHEGRGWAYNELMERGWLKK